MSIRSSQDSFVEFTRAVNPVRAPRGAEAKAFSLARPAPVPPERGVPTSGIGWQTVALGICETVAKRDKFLVSAGAAPLISSFNPDA